jgi:cystathionine beta-lyase/cystathionine gamma-synthase
MITFELSGGRSACETFVNSIRDRVAYVPTLGDANSILLHVESVFGSKYPLPGMIRFSVGCERFDNLRDVIEHGLDKVRSS